MLKEFRK